MTRFEKKEELIGLFSSGSILIGDMLDEAMDFAEKNIGVFLALIERKKGE